nr:MAG TPA: hypothetical protein [Caudoviricetes sp.]
MSDCPSSPLIRITAGSLGEVPLHGALAASAGLAATGSSLKYRIIQGSDVGSLIGRDDPDSVRILAWEDVIPVPAADLKNLRNKFRGALISERRPATPLKVTSALKSLEPSPPDLAVTRVNNLLDVSRTLLDVSSDRYLSPLLRSLSDFHEVECGPKPRASQSLTTIGSICVRWIAEVAPTGSPYREGGEEEVLSGLRAKAESDPAVGGFPAMVERAGDAAARIDEAWETEEGQERLAPGLLEPALTLGHYALALLAKSLKDGE